MMQPRNTLINIASRWFIPGDSLIVGNNLTPPYNIFTGQQLSIPPGLRYYVVQSGDTLYQIAHCYNATTNVQKTVEFIKQINQLPSYQLFPEMRLIIPYSPPRGNEQLVFISNVSGSHDLWVYSLGNSRYRQLTFGLAESFSVPFSSPDSSKIAFVGKDGIIYVITVETGKVARIDQFDDGLGVFLNWSPNSKKLVYSKPEGIFIYDMESHRVQRLNFKGTSDAQWFPNGEEILFQAQDEDDISQLYRVKQDGNNRSQVTKNTEGPLHNVRLSPNGKFALYTTPGASISIIYIVDLSNGNTLEIEGGPLAKNFFPNWSPDSNHITYSATAFENNGYFSQVRVVDGAGLRDQIHAVSDCYATPVIWSPDSQHIAYLSGCSGGGAAREIWLLNRKHPVPIKLVTSPSIVSFDWLPSTGVKKRKTLISQEYKVQLKYPDHWVQVAAEKFEGKDGFFQLSAISSNSPMEIVCQNEAFHKLQPYGSNPRIIKTHIKNQEACLIFPSADQSAEMKGQAALIVPYLQPVVINGSTYNYFILWADKRNIEELGETLNFLT